MASPTSLTITEGQGLLLRAIPDGQVLLQIVADKHYPHIHPNCYAPRHLRDLSLLHGGGSGTAVFGGFEDDRRIVLKHASHKDTREILALTQISHQLACRSVLDADAARRMQNRIPQFLFCYISPFHVRDRSQEAWSSLRAADYDAAGTRYSGTPTAVPSTPTHPAARNRKLILTTPTKELDVSVGLTSILVDLPPWEPDGDGGYRLVLSEPHVFWQTLQEQLSLLQQQNAWKVTLAQTWIGGENPVNTATRWTTGTNLDVHHLLGQVQELLDDLQLLTRPEERTGVDLVRTSDPFSDVTDVFVGGAIQKNLRRFANLRHILDDLSHHRLVLMEHETTPGHYLGRARTDFAGVLGLPGSALDALPPWETLTRDATRLNRNCTDRVWTAGLTDAGLHNTFLTPHCLYIFDLGAPRLEPRPALLTKFLMSLFHTFGMMPDDEDDNGWKCHFVERRGRLWVRDETQARLDALPVQCILETLADTTFGTREVIPLLIRYMVLQLLSDAAFCLERWEAKGGGTLRDSDTLSKWLWRSLWDQYAAAYVYYNRDLYGSARVEGVAGVEGVSGVAGVDLDSPAGRGAGGGVAGGGGPGGGG